MALFAGLPRYFKHQFSIFRTRRNRSIGGVFFVGVLALGSILAQNVIATGWEKTKGPTGLKVSVFLKANNSLFAGTESLGIYRSEDNGASWADANHGIERTDINDLVYTGTSLLAAAASTNCSGSINIFRSTDNGATWVPTIGLGGLVVRTLAVKGSVVYAGISRTNGSGLYRSMDDGATWQQVPSNIFEVDKIFVSNSTMLIGSNNLMWATQNDGASWTAFQQFSVSLVNSFARVGSRLFAAGGNLIMSDDNGVHWTSAAIPGIVNSIASDGTTLYLGSKNKVYRSDNAGATWTEVSTGLGKGSIQAMLIDAGSLYAATPNDIAGTYKSTNGGASWSSAAQGLPVGSEIRSLVTFEGKLYAGTDSDGIYRSADHGNSWSRVDPSNLVLGQQIIFEFCVKGSMLFAAATNGIYRSTDGGATFQLAIDGFPANINVTAYSLTVSGNNLLAAVSVSTSPTSSIAGIFYSSDNGSTWHSSILQASVTGVSTVASDGSLRAYAGVYTQSFLSKGLYLSNDGGLTWTYPFSLNVDVENLTVKGNNVLASTLFTGYYSFDHGEAQWGISSLPGTGQYDGGIFTYTWRGNSVYAGNDGMYVSANGGVSWSPINEGFPVCPLPTVLSSAADNNYLYAGTTDEGVWRKLITPVASAPFDFDGDGKTDISIFRPSAGEWWYSRSSDAVVRAGQFGTSTDIPTPGDFTGDGKADIAFWRPSDGFWYILRSEDGSFFSFPFGTNGDIPMPADFDADGKTDAAIFRPSTGTWFIPQSGGGGTLIGQFGANGDLPVAADYDGDGKADVAIIRRNAGNMEWWMQRTTAGFFVAIFGVSADKAVPGDYTGDGKTDIAVWRPSTGFWFVLRSEDSSYFSFPFGTTGDIPAPGDYDGDGKTDATVFRPSAATWFVNRSGGSGTLIAGFGAPTDQPVPSVFVR